MELGEKTPTVYVIAGSNGSGKTTFASDFLPAFVACREFLNADLIAAGLSPFAPESQNLRAERLLLERIEELSHARRNFAIETTLAGRTSYNRLAKLQDDSYRVVLFFLWLPSADAAVARVANRVAQGGHGIPERDVRRRYESGLRNLFQRFRPLVDSWWLYDASWLPPRLVAVEIDGTSVIIVPIRVRAFGNRLRVDAVDDKTDSFEALRKKADAAFAQAAVKVVERARQTNTPVIICEDGQIKRIPAAEMAERLKLQNGEH